MDGDASSPYPAWSRFNLIGCLPRCPLAHRGGLDF